jgi:hypothetical protein
VLANDRDRLVADEGRRRPSRITSRLVLDPKAESAITIDSGEELMVETWDALEGERDPAALEEKAPCEDRLPARSKTNGAEAGEPSSRQALFKPFMAVANLHRRRRRRTCSCCELLRALVSLKSEHGEVREHVDQRAHQRVIVSKYQRTRRCFRPCGYSIPGGSSPVRLISSWIVALSTSQV